MVIGVCDDNEVMRKYMVKSCETIAAEFDDEILIRTFQDGSAVLNQDLDILILDIEMKDVDGITVKDTFQRKDKNTIIIFVTSHSELMPQAFGVNVIGFVTKNFIEEQLPPILTLAVKKVLNTVSVDGVDSRDICYIEAEHVYNMLHTVGKQEILVRISSSELEQMLSGVGFIRVHRAYIVNMAFVDGIHEKSIIVDGQEIPVSSRLRSKIKKDYDKYCRENVRFC